MPARRNACTTVGADAIEQRALELLAAPDIADANLCHACSVLIPFTDDCYAIDSDGVCLPCGAQRELPDSYRLQASPIRPAMQPDQKMPARPVTNPGQSQTSCASTDLVIPS